jgi:NAD(P)-dependent dehydrogenase (short-subunit alcohol dehydrogenase family)
MINQPVALVTGASRGIGRGAALRLARDGYAVIINSLTADSTCLTKGAYEVKQTIEAAGGKAFVFRADISSTTERQALVGFVENEIGRLDLLVNNAGIEPEALDMLESSEERYQKVLSINLQGPYFLTQQIALRMILWKEAGWVDRPRIIFVTSVQGYMTNPQGAEYCLTKAALHMAMQLNAHRLGPHGINVYEIRPGIIETDMSLKFKESIDHKIASGGLLTSRWGQPEDMAALISAIGRGDLDYSTGVTFDVDGGMSVRRL